MLVFIDEVGDHGVKFNHNSSRYFTVAMIVFHDVTEAEACNQAIETLRQELNLPHKREFHFSKTPDRLRIKFIKTIQPFNFFYYAFIIDKQLLRQVGYYAKLPFYEYSSSEAEETRYQYVLLPHPIPVSF
jgi:hypothetical protein